MGETDVSILPNHGCATRLLLVYYIVNTTLLCPTAHFHLPPSRSICHSTVDHQFPMPLCDRLWWAKGGCVRVDHGNHIKQRSPAQGRLTHRPHPNPKHNSTTTPPHRHQHPKSHQQRPHRLPCGPKPIYKPKLTNNCRTLGPHNRISDPVSHV